MSRLSERIENFNKVYELYDEMQKGFLSDKKQNSYRIAWELYELPTPYKFDVTSYKSLTNEKFKKNIDLDGKLFYSR